jgi:hypothetical protein
VRQSQSQLTAEVNKWNACFPVGTPVLYTPVAGLQETRIEYTRSTATIVAGASAVVWITGHMCAIAIAWLKPMPEYSMPRPAAQLHGLRSVSGLIFAVGPLMAYYRRVIDCVQRAGLDPQAAELSVLFHDVLEGHCHPMTRRYSERVKQSRQVLRRHDALNVFLTGCQHAKVGR